MLRCCAVQARRSRRKEFEKEIETGCLALVVPETDQGRPRFHFVPGFRLRADISQQIVTDYAAKNQLVLGRLVSIATGPPGAPPIPPAVPRRCTIKVEGHARPVQMRLQQPRDNSSVLARRCPTCSAKGTIPCDVCFGQGEIICGHRAVARCSGAGTIRSGKRCYDCLGTKQVSGCGGSRKVACDGCSGKKTVPCNRCNGSGNRIPRIDCQRCNASGRIQRECQSCSGTGSFGGECHKCGGSGDFAATCKKCNGSGYFADGECWSCSGTGQKQFDCNLCDGTGYYSRDCNRCSGNGSLKLACFSCDGKGYRDAVPCDSCSGKGRVKCSVCSGIGTRRCRVCGETGKLTCKKCWPSKLLRCPECRGEGWLLGKQIACSL